MTMSKWGCKRLLRYYCRQIVRLDRTPSQPLPLFRSRSSCIGMEVLRGGVGLWNCERWQAAGCEIVISAERTSSGERAVCNESGFQAGRQGGPMLPSFGPPRFLVATASLSYARLLANIKLFSGGRKTHNLPSLRQRLHAYTCGGPQVGIETPSHLNCKGRVN